MGLWRYKNRLVEAPPELVWAAQSVPIGHGSGREFSLVAGTLVVLVAGLLGAGAVWLFCGNREPRLGERVTVLPNTGTGYQGTWGGTDPQGNFLVNGKPVDPDTLSLCGPVKYIKQGPHTAQEVVDLTRGWASHEALGKFKAAHNREGYKRRKRNA